MLVVILPDGSRKQFDRPVSTYDVAAEIGPGLAKAAILAEVDGKQVDLHSPLPHNGEIRLLLAGTSLVSVQAAELVIESWRNDDLTSGTTRSSRPSTRAPRHQGQFKPIGADRIQRRAQRAARRRHRRRPHHLPSVRRLARAVQEGQARPCQRHDGDGELLRRRQERLDRRTTARRRSACRWPR